MGIDSPIIGELTIHVHYVPGGEVDRGYGAERDRRAVVPGCRTGEAVVARYVGIKTPKVLPLRAAGRHLVIKVVGRDAIHHLPSQIGLRVVRLDVLRYRIELRGWNLVIGEWLPGHSPGACTHGLR